MTPEQIAQIKGRMKHLVGFDEPESEWARDIRSLLNEVERLRSTLKLAEEALENIALSCKLSWFKKEGATHIAIEALIKIREHLK